MIQITDIDEFLELKKPCTKLNLWKHLYILLNKWKKERTNSKLKYRKYFLTCNKENARPQSKASSPQPERREWLSRHVQLILCPRACADLGHPRPAQRPAKGHAHTLDLPRRRSFPNCKKTIFKFIIFKCAWWKWSCLKWATSISCHISNSHAS